MISLQATAIPPPTPPCDAAPLCGNQDEYQSLRPSRKRESRSFEPAAFAATDLSYGQADDITVLTLTFAPVGAAVS